MTNTPGSKQPSISRGLSLAQGFSKILPTGGIAAFQDNSFLLDDNALEIFQRLKIENTEALMSVFMMTHSFHDKQVAEELLALGMNKGIIGKDELVTLYRMQTPEKREEHPLLTLEMLWNISHHSSGNKTDAPLHPNQYPFEKEDIVLLANEFIRIHQRDIWMFFGSWFYRDTELPFSEAFLSYWYEKTGGPFPEVCDGKTASLIAIAFQRKYPMRVTLDDVTKRLIILSERNPHDHGIYRYCSLCFLIAGDDTGKRTKVLEAWVSSITCMIDHGNLSFGGANLSLEILLTTTDITDEEKNLATTEIDRHCKSRASELFWFVEITKNTIL